MVDVCVLGPSKSFLQEALVRDLDPRTHQGGDDVVSDFSIRVRQAATSDDVKDASRWWTRPQERIVRLETSPFQSRVFWHKISCTTASTWCSILGTVRPSRPLGSVNRTRLALYLASRQVRRKLNMVAS